MISCKRCLNLPYFENLLSYGIGFALTVIGKCIFPLVFDVMYQPKMTFKAYFLSKMSFLSLNQPE